MYPKCTDPKKVEYWLPEGSFSVDEGSDGDDFDSLDFTPQVHSAWVTEEKRPRSHTVGAFDDLTLSSSPERWLPKETPNPFDPPTTFHLSDRECKTQEDWRIKILILTAFMVEKQRQFREDHKIDFPNQMWPEFKNFETDPAKVNDENFIPIAS